MTEPDAVRSVATDAVAAEVQKIAGLLRSGKSPAEVQRLMSPAFVARALRVCAVAGVITPGLYDSVLRRHAQPDAPELAPLASRGLLEPVAGPEPGWRVPPDEAARLIREWRSAELTAGPPPDLLELEAELARWHEERGDVDERLRHLLVADPRQAAGLFQSLFAEADQQRDFTRCQDLLDVLADPARMTLAGPDISSLRLDRAGYLRARQYWSADYARSAQFLVPPGLRERTDRLLGPAGPRIWQVYAPTGTGKTIQLQWLVARRCVTPAADIPCARIDFDVIDPVNAARRPWLLLLEIADQLDRRWARRVFERLDQFRSYRALAQRTAQESDLAREAAKGLGSRDEATLAPAVTETFVRRFNEAAGERPAVLVLDTIEEVMLGRAIDPAGLLRLLVTLTRECPSLRLVLAGRYDLRQQAPEWMRELAPAESVELVDFAPEQVSAYLAGLRGITDPALHKAVLARTGGQPILVALYADYIEQFGDVTADDIRRQGDPLIRLLIDRIIRRIDDYGVRWLVRYGIVPRRLRLEDVTEVIGPFLVRGMPGPTPEDDPQADREDGRRLDDAFPFGQPPHGTAELAGVWQRLLAYAARPSWISPAADGQSVVFHPHVRAAMRELLEQRPVFTQLHEAFIARFEALAANSPMNRVGYLREIVYHRIQLDRDDAIKFWRNDVIRCRDAGDLDGMEELAGELLRPDYADNSGDGRAQPPRPGQAGLSGSGLSGAGLPGSVLAEAHIFRAYVSAERARAARADSTDPLWAEAQRSLALAARAGQPDAPLAAALQVVVRAAWLVAESRPAEAIALAEPALVGAAADSRVDLLRVIGDARAAQGNASSGPTWNNALELAGQLGRVDQENEIVRSLATESAAQGRLDRAFEWISRLARPAMSTVTSVRNSWRVTLARVQIDCYQPAAALHSLENVRPSDSVAAVTASLVRAAAYELLGRAGHALAELDAAADAAGRSTDSGRYTQLAEIHQLRGVILGHMLAVDAAEASFQLAASLWAELGFAEGNPSCAFQYRRFLIREVGDLRAAAQVPTPAFAGDRYLALRWAEGTAELRAAQGRSASLLTEASLTDLEPRQQAAIIAAALARSWEPHRSLLPVLTRALGRISPATARLVVLDELRRYEQPLPPRADVKALRQALEVAAQAGDNAAGQADRALQQGLLAELDRLAGSRVKARRGLTASIAQLPPLPAGQLARWRYVQARARLNPPQPVGKQQVAALGKASEGYPLLQAACLLTLAAADPPPRPGRARMAEAVALCEQVSRPTRWLADCVRTRAVLAGDSSLLATAADLDQQLGWPRRRTTARLPRPPAQVLSDRVGERAVSLTARQWMAPDIPLQRRLVADWPKLASDLDALVSPAIAGEQAGLRALRLESDKITVQAMPWELSEPSPEHPGQIGRQWPAVAYRSMPEAAMRIDTRWLQHALRTLGHDLPVDGVLGPTTLRELASVTPAGLPLSLETRAELENALRRVRTDAAGQRPLAVLVRPDASVERMVSSHSDSGFDVADFYARCGVEVRTVRSLADAPPPTPRERVAVVHITGRMGVHDSDPYVDFSPVEVAERLGWKERGTDIRPRDIGRWLRECVPGQEPLVVLDPPHPGSPLDVPWQLVLRNLFAAALFADGSAPAIIATGVRAFGGAYVVPIAQGVALRRPVGEIAAELRPEAAGPGVPARPAPSGQPDWGFVNDALAAQATAVFAAPSAYALEAG
jgi:hypothetical protein